jgi:hypothetical protein
MSNHEEEDITRAKKAVRAAYDDLQELRASRDSKIPLSLSNASAALDKLSCNLDLLTYPEALTIFRAFTLKSPNGSIETALSDALERDMEAVATHFKFMKPMGPTETPDDLNEQECRNIEDLVVRYDIIVFSVLTRHNAYVYCGQLEACILLTDHRLILDSLSVQGHEMRERMMATSHFLSEYQSSEAAGLRTSE